MKINCKIIDRKPVDDWTMVTVSTPRGECFISQWSSMSDDEVLEMAALWASSV